MRGLKPRFFLRPRGRSKEDQSIGLDAEATIVLIVDSLVYFFAFAASVFLAYLFVRRLNVSGIFRRSSLPLKKILLTAFTRLIYMPLEFIFKKALILSELRSLRSGFYFATEFIEGLLPLLVLVLAALALLGTEDWWVSMGSDGIAAPRRRGSSVLRESPMVLCQGWVQA